MRDRTASVARRLRNRLHHGEAVGAAVAVAARGTAAAELAGAARAADGAPTIEPDGELARSRAALEADGFGSGVRFWLVLTDVRVLLVRRTVLGRSAEAALDAPVGSVAGIRLSPQAHGVTVDLVDGRSIPLEAPKAFRHLPPVYGRLPELLDAARGGSPPAG